MTKLTTRTRDIDNRRLLDLQIGKVFMSKLGTHVAWEGFGERAALLLLDRRTDLLEVNSQPERMRILVNGKVTSYTADFEVIFRQQPIEIWEVKGQLALQQEKVIQKLAAVEEAVARSNRIFRVFNSRELTDSVELRNTRLLKRYAPCSPTSEQSSAVVSFVQEQNMVPLGIVIDAARQHGITRQHVYCLLYRGQLSMNWNELVSDVSPISLGKFHADI